MLGKGKITWTWVSASRAMIALAIVLSTSALCVPANAAAHDSAHDWPMWGYNPARNALSPAVLSLPETLHLQWVRELPPPRRAWTRQLDDADKMEFDLSYSPIVADNRLFVSSMTTDRLTAYAADTGEELWRFYADGPMRVAPAAWNGKVYAASDDGRMYCLDAATGTLLWSFDAALSDHRVLGNERIISMWPVRGGPVVADGTLYFAAGIWPFLGTALFALDAETGAVQWTNSGFSTEYQLQPHGGAYAFAGLAPQGYLAVHGNRLVAAGGRALPGLFDRRDGTMLFHQVQAGKGSGGYRVRIKDQFYLNHGLRFHLDDGSTAGHGSVGEEALASLRRTIAAGEPVDRDHPFILRTLMDASVASVEDRLDGPVFDSLVAQGRLYVVTESGQLYCFGEAPSGEPRTYAYEPAAPPAVDSDAGNQAARILAETGVTDGYALVLGAGNGDLLEQLAARSELRLAVVEPDPGRVEAVRRRLDDAGLYGTRIAVIPGHFRDMHYPDYVSSLIVATDLQAHGLTPDAGTLARLEKHLRPYSGRAWLALNPGTHAWRTALESFKPEAGRVSATADALLIQREGPLPDTGQWTHQHADASQSVLSHDYRVRPPFGPIWFGGPSHDNILPRHAAGPRPQVAAGRLVILGVETISARCVYTGRELWVRDFPGIGHPFTNLELEERWAQGEAVYMTNQPGATYIGSPYVSLPDAVYLRYQGHVYRLDPKNGDIVARWELPARPPDRDEPDWGHISVADGMVITTTNPHIFRGGALGTFGEDSWDGTSSERLVALDRHTGEVAWTRDAAIGFRHNAIVAANGRLFVNDLLSEQALQMAMRRGRTIQDRPRLMALDIRTGKEMWNVESEVFGTFLTYSQEHDILLEGGTRDGRRHVDDEPTSRLVARGGSDGTLLWDRQDNVSGPVILRDDMIIPGRPGEAINLMTGGAVGRIHPITGEELAWSYWKTYGCGSANASQHLLLFRSGAAGFHDISDGGTGTLGGFRAGCTANMVAADGVLNAPDYTRTCTCSYQNQTSLGLVYMPEMEMWTFNRTLADFDGPVRRVGVNLGAPGDRRADNGTLWIHVPQMAPSPELDVTLLSTDNVVDTPVKVVATRGHRQLDRRPEHTVDGNVESTWRIDCLRTGRFDEELHYVLSDPITFDRLQVAWQGPEATQFRIEATEKIEDFTVMDLPRENWKFRTDPDDQGEVSGWFDPQLDDTDWDTIGIERSWTQFDGYGSYTGPAWYRRTVTLPARPGGLTPAQVDAAELQFGGVDEMAWVWINGQFVGSHDFGPAGWDMPFEIPVTDAVRWGEENQITVRAMNTQAAGGIWQPVTLQVTRGQWRTVYTGSGTGSGQEFETYRFNPVTAQEVRLVFDEHGDQRQDSRGRRLNLSLAVYQVRIGELPYPEAYAMFAPRRFYRKNSLLVDGSQGLNWVAASGLHAVQEFVLRNVHGNGEPYTVTLHFAEPENIAAGQRFFDIHIGEQNVIRNFDVIQAAGGSARAITLSLEDVHVDEDLRLTFQPSNGSLYPPILSGVELVRQ